MRALQVALVTLLLSGCAQRRPTPRPAQPIQELTFTKLQGQELAVRVVNRDLAFAGSADAVRAAHAAIKQQLSDKGVRVIDSAPRTWVLELADAMPTGGPGQHCVRVDAHLEQASQAFLPSRTSSAVRCSGEGPGPADGRTHPIALLWEMGRMAVNATDGTYAKEHAAALFYAIEAALLQLDASTKY